MNIGPVITYLATQFYTHVRICSREGAVMEETTRRIDLKDAFREHAELRSRLLASASEDAPQVCRVGAEAAYGLVRFGETVYVLGPVHIPGSGKLLAPPAGGDFPEFDPANLATCSLVEFINGLLLLHNLLHDAQLTANECSERIARQAHLGATVEEKLTGLLFQNRENLSHHNPYDHEQREMDSIEAGDLARLRACWEEQFSGAYGVITADPVQNGKYLAMIVIALASRAAIRGGALPEQAFSMADMYLQQIDQVRNPLHIDTICKDAKIAFAQQVRELRRSEKAEDADPLVRQCKDYVFLHLHEKITVQDVGSALHLHPNYLSTYFARREGVSLYQFILREKIGVARTLLTYSQYGYEEIANYLGFSTQSHFGSTFRRLTGMTPRQYRAKYQKKREDAAEL